MKLKRRDFLKLSGASVGALMLGSNAEAIRLPNPLAKVPEPWHKGEVKTMYTVCENCFWHCGIKAYISDGKVFKVEGYEENPKSRGKLCPRGQGAIMQTYDPDRLKKPLIRQEGSERGEGKYREAEWDEALDYIAEKMLKIKEEYGSESMAFFAHGSGDSWFTEYLAGAWASPNAAKPSVSICTSPRETASQYTFGRGIGGHEPIDWEETKYIVLIGHHIGEDTHNTQLQAFSIARKRGAKLAVVDPRFSTAASKADTWLPIKPGTDTALLLAWIHVLIYEDLFDREYVKKYTEGFAQLKAHVKDFSPEWAAKITDLKPEQITKVARELAHYAPRAIVPPGRHTVWYGNDTQRMRALYIVNALLGNYGVPGGFYLSKPAYLEKFPHPSFPLEPSSGGCSGSGGSAPKETGFRPSADHGKFFAHTTAVQELIEPMISGEPYPIKGLIAYGVNLFHSIPDVERTKKALKALDLYVAIDIMPMEHVMWADVILPEDSYLERYDDLFAIAHKTPFISLRQPVIERIWDTKPGWWISREIGMRVGLADYYPWENIEEYLEKRLRAIGSSLDKIKEKGTLIQKGRPYLVDWEARGRLPFKTKSGKIELYSETFKEAGFEPMPVYTETLQAPQGFYRLLYGRSPVHTFAKTQNNWLLMEMHGENGIWINRERAADMGLKTGDYVYLENQDGIREGPIAVYATERIRKDCVYMVHGFGHKAGRMKIANNRGASDNYLQSNYSLDPISGGAGLRNNFVKIIPGAKKPRLPRIARLAKERSI